MRKSEGCLKKEERNKETVFDFAGPRKDFIGKKGRQHRQRGLVTRGLYKSSRKERPWDACHPKRVMPRRTVEGNRRKNGQGGGKRKGQNHRKGTKDMKSLRASSGRWRKNCQGRERKKVEAGRKPPACGHQEQQEVVEETKTSQTEVARGSKKGKKTASNKGPE